MSPGVLWLALEGALHCIDAYSDAQVLTLIVLIACNCKYKEDLCNTFLFLFCCNSVVNGVGCVDMFVSFVVLFVHILIEDASVRSFL